MGPALLVYSCAMHEIGWQTRIRRAHGIGIAVLVVAIAAAMVVAFFPGSLRGPETMARQYLEALLQAPGDAARLRALAHLAEADDPEILLEGLATRVALDFLRARERQGAVHNIEVAEARRPTPPVYEVVLWVVESADGRTVQRRRFQVNLHKADNGDWRIGTVALSE